MQSFRFENKKNSNNNLMANKSSEELLEAINYMTALNCASNSLIFPKRWREKKITRTTKSAVAAIIRAAVPI